MGEGRALDGSGRRWSKNFNRSVWVNAVTRVMCLKVVSADNTLGLKLEDTEEIIILL